LISSCKKQYGKKIKKKLLKKGNPKPQDQEKYERKLWRPYNPWTLP
jgi:hypothetical protein